MAKQPKIQYINSYISGNAAYAFPETVQEPKKRRVRLPKQKAAQKYVLELYPAAILAVGLSLVLAVAIVVRFVQLQNLQAEAESLEQYISRLETTQEQLLQEYAEGYDPEEIMKNATAMGMVPVEELPHIPIEVYVPAQPAEPTFWENIWAFFRGLFA